jgi:hypothetical protein
LQFNLTYTDIGQEMRDKEVSERFEKSPEKHK